MQTTNEELETAKEEMQSSNEELSTLNEELQNRNHELDQLASDLSNLLTGVEIPIVILGGDLRIRRFTPPAEKLLNFVPSDIGRPIGHIKPRIHGANLEELAAEVVRTGQVVEQEVRDNEGRWHSLRMRPFKSAENKIDSVLLALVDITEMKQAEAEGQRDREATISALLENAAQGIIAIDEQGRIRIINSMVEVLFGYNRNELLGQTVEILLPDRFRGTHSKHREEFLAQPRVRPMGIGLDLFGLRKDGIEFPIEVSLGHIESRQGRLAIGFISNVTERKKSEEQLGRNRRDLQALTRKLIATQEDRYRDLARELHDVFNQRLAALGILIGEIKGQAPLEAQGLQANLNSVQEEIVQLASSLHDMSRQLHPAVLDDLGLATALENECRAFSKQYEIQAEFRSKGIPKSLPQNIRVCLYRVAQECLLNVGKHSASERVEVTLTAGKGEIVLRVMDVGDGFDLEQVRGKGGLGLVSMEERLRLVGGSLSVESQPGVGTRVEAHAPLRAKSVKKAGK